ncbi:MAG: plasma-membrane proton-efflux P-type ATPase [Syntrophales bacterium]
MNDPVDIEPEKTEFRNGLTSEEARKRIQKYGYNEIPEKRRHPGIRLIRKFWGLTPWMLEITILLEFFLGKFFEMYVVAGLLFFNAVLGFFQEERANSALELLRRNLKVNARIKRDGKWQIVPAMELVPGDIIRLRTGDFVPADVRAMEGGAEIDQSSLTGESQAVEKKKSDILYSGSIVKRGEVTGVVVVTGAGTYFGRTVELVQIARPRLHMEEVTSRVVKWLVAIVSFFLVLALVFTILRGAANVFEVLPLAVVLMVSAIPVALPTMFTISMALGSLELIKKGVLITRLSTIEDAATMDILCADKTGTMTMNKLSVAEVIAADGYTREDVLLFGALASQEADQDPIDLAFIAAAQERGISSADYRLVKFIPFDPSTRKTEAEIIKEPHTFRVLKGAVNTLIPLCRGNKEELPRMQDSVERFSSKGYRAIAVAVGTDGGDASLAGIAFLYDRPRSDSRKFLSDLKELSLKVKILTGDAVPVAREIMEELGLGKNIERFPDLKGKTEHDIAHLVENADGFAEIYPEDKYLIVKALQEEHHIVAMTGDGVNDAPALRQAEVGIAVSNATDVAKSAAGAVLTTEGLEGIVELVKIGRMTYQRIITWILNKVIKTFQITVFVVLFFLLTGTYVISALHMILLLFLTDFVTLSLSTDRVRYSKTPDHWNITGLIKVAVLLGILVICELMILIVSSMHFGVFENVNQMQTFTFELFIFMELLDLMIIRERGRFWVSRPSQFLLFTVIADLAVVFAISIFGLPGIASVHPAVALTVPVFASAVVFLINDPVKVRLIRRYWIFA